jgi:hypothetical protein
MRAAQRAPRRRMRRMRLFLMPLALLPLHSPAFGQQEFVTRYDAFAGYTFLNSPHVSLFENGFATQIGFRPKTWYSVGFDYTLAAGDGTITPSLLPSNLQQQLAAQLAQLAEAGRIPPGYNLVVPFHSRTQTFAVGPQLAFRHFRRATIFARPLFAGAIHETATPQPADPIAGAIVGQLVPAGHKTDVVGFVGFGGGIDILFSRHFAMRTQADVVHDHLFNDLLKDGRWTVRFSVGPAFNFGKNIKK